ncbi:hypothetical protein DPMN_173384 [Dreissena polymorpha]|uniref:Uncharacterized protein n=1 Tax=Dreissena polymorpha TaxID=45954 RepID=A0A9D4E5D0_DREPO|nr:hypothetical protein DPMN_173384 [Dreissena polymorpha]
MIPCQQNLKPSGSNGELIYETSGLFRFLEATSVRTSPQSMDRVESHVFSDASESSIAAVSYMVGFRVSGEISDGFVSEKAKVAPASGHTIPRLQ